MAPLPLSGKRILVVEDNAENRRLFNAVLKLDGATVLEAEGANMGLQMAGAEQPDLILMDIHMPDMDGLTATRLLRSDPKTAAIPIVAVTASVMAKDRDKILEAGCDGHIAKPIDPMSFTEEIATYFKEESDT